MASGTMIIDSSAGRGDGWSWCIAQHVCEPSGETRELFEPYEYQDGRTGRIVRDRRQVFDRQTHRPALNPKWSDPRRVLWVSAIGAIEGKFAETTTFSAVVGKCAAVARRWGVSHVFGDGFEAFSLESEFARHGMRFEKKDWSAASKIEAAAVLRRMIREQTFVIADGPEGELVKRDLLSLEEKFTPSGAITISARRSRLGHSDRGMMTLLVARLESEGALRGSPIARRTAATYYAPGDGSSGYTGPVRMTNIVL